MQETLDELSDNELYLYNRVTAVRGTMDDKINIISTTSIFSDYKNIHIKYSNIFKEAKNSEALKRAILYSGMPWQNLRL